MQYYPTTTVVVVVVVEEYIIPQQRQSCRCSRVVLSYYKKSLSSFNFLFRCVFLVVRKHHDMQI